MTDMQDIRARLREAGHQPAPSGGGGLPFWIVAAVAVAVGFSVVLFTPRLYSVQRTAALPTFQETRDRLEAGEAGRSGSAMTPAVSNPALYVGKSADEMGKIADGVCFQRAHALEPHWSKTPRLTTKELSDFDVPSIKHFDVLMHCLATEAPGRFCSGAQRNMIKAEIAMYFRGVEHAGTVMKTVVADHQKFRTKSGFETDPEIMKFASRPIAPNEKVLAGIEGLMRAGYLTAVQRGDINAVAPRPVRERLARVVVNKSPCPEPPWWAVWR